jgi:integrase/recombinase XerD
VSSLSRQREKGLQKGPSSPYSAFLSHVEATKATATHLGYSRTLRAFQRAFPSPFGIQPQQVREWIARDDHAPNTQRTETGCLKGFWRWLNEEYSAVNIMADVPFPPRPQHIRPRSITRAQVNEVIDALTTDSQRTIALLMADAGLRVSEACSLTPERVVFSGRRSYLRVMGKGNKERLVPIGSRLATALAAIEADDRKEPLVRTKTGRPYTRGIVWEMIAVAGLRAGIEGMHPHRLRHSWACWLHYERHVPLGIVSRLLGHANLSTTQTYLGVRDEELFDYLTE